MQAISFADRDGFIWFDGELRPWRDCTTHVLTHTLHYGLGCFEGVRAYKTDRGPAVFRLKDHTKRFFDSARILNIKIPFSMEEINLAHKEVIKVNELEHAYIRPMCFLGAEGMGLRADNLKVHIIVAAWPWGAYMGEENMTRGIKVRTSSFTRHHVNITMTKAKANGNYMNSILALQEALAAGADEALLLDPAGYVSEGSGENVFIVRGGKLVTPELVNCLDGITRRTVFELAGYRGIEVIAKKITRDEMYIADEAFFTGTAAEVTPINELDGRVIGMGGRGPITKAIQSDYFDLVHGKMEKNVDWVDLVGV